MYYIHQMDGKDTDNYPSKQGLCAAFPVLWGPAVVENILSICVFSLLEFPQSMMHVSEGEENETHIGYSY